MTTDAGMFGDLAAGGLLRGLGPASFSRTKAIVANPLHAPACDRIQRRRAQGFTGAQTETRVMPGTTHRVVDDEALGEWSVIVRAIGADGEQGLATAHEDRLFGFDAPEDHPTIR